MQIENAVGGNAITVINPANVTVAHATKRDDGIWEMQIEFVNSQRVWKCQDSNEHAVRQFMNCLHDRIVNCNERH